jgi:hypothetical protein
MKDKIQQIIISAQLGGISSIEATQQVLDLKTPQQLNEASELNISDVSGSLTLEDITKIVNAFTDINIPIEAVREEIELNYL